MTIKWKFRQIQKVEDRRFDQALNDFYALGDQGVIKESIQSSFDVKTPERDKELNETSIIEDERTNGIKGVNSVLLPSMK